MTGTASQATAAATGATGRPSIAQRLHHSAIVVADQEVTRRFYEDLIGLPLVATWCEAAEIGGKDRVYCHTFYELADGSALAFFQFADPTGYDDLASNVVGSLNHIALSVTAQNQRAVIERLEREGVAHRVVDHGYCKSLYVTDPDGSTLELTVDPPNAADIAAKRRADAHSELARWLAGDHQPNNDLRALGSV
jgi:catechol 2,3-dioxygenase-like lactoylglutathione lyase family enzyme